MKVPFLLCRPFCLVFLVKSPVQISGAGVRSILQSMSDSFQLQNLRLKSLTSYNIWRGAYFEKGHALEQFFLLIQSFDSKIRLALLIHVSIPKGKEVQQLQAVMLLDFRQIKPQIFGSSLIPYSTTCHMLMAFDYRQTTDGKNGRSIVQSRNFYLKICNWSNCNSVQCTL